MNCQVMKIGSHLEPVVALPFLGSTMSVSRGAVMPISDRPENQRVENSAAKSHVVD